MVRVSLKCTVSNAAYSYYPIVSYVVDDVGSKGRSVRGRCPNTALDVWCIPTAEWLEVKWSIGVLAYEPAPVSLCFSGCFATKGTLKQKIRLTYIMIGLKDSRNLF
jgi:hypothetical protein